MILLCGVLSVSVRLLVALGALHEEVVSGAVAAHSGEIELRRDRNLAVGTDGGEVDGELVRRDPDPLAEEREEALEIERGVHRNGADVDLAAAVGVHDGDRRASSVDHYFIFLRRVLGLCVVNRFKGVYATLCTNGRKVVCVVFHNVGFYV